MKTFWDQRYQNTGWAYGNKPNHEFELFLKALKPGKILLPGEGEGRNAIYAARTGWQVEAFDYSEAGKHKALSLAAREQLKINYTVSNVETFTSDQKFDLIALIYLHLPPDIRTQFHRKIKELLNPNGTLFIQAFAKDQLKRNSGGPKNEIMLYSIEELQADFDFLEITEARQHQINLDEGPFHQGIAENITFIGKLR